MYVLANLALGGGWPLDGLASPAVMQIEHIQVFQDQSRLSPRLGEAGSDPERCATERLPPEGWSRSVLRS